MTLGSQRAAGTRAILRELPVPMLAPLGSLKATAKIRAKVKVRTPLAAQVEDPDSILNHGIQTAVSHRAQVDGEETLGDESANSRGRGRSDTTNTTASFWTTASSSNSIPAITFSESSSPDPGHEDIEEAASCPIEAAIEAEIAAQAQSGSGIEPSLGSTIEGGSASSGAWKGASIHWPGAKIGIFNISIIIIISGSGGSTTSTSTTGTTTATPGIRENSRSGPSKPSSEGPAADNSKFPLGHFISHSGCLFSAIPARHPPTTHQHPPSTQPVYPLRYLPSNYPLHSAHYRFFLSQSSPQNSHACPPTYE
ncbi:uncharacterized protein Z519_06047 [Cladophialophora bantiana CBS 173.52]|uniref:Uncharacterized protein n=1 Tax=Cladophialophora bantiana (strain ATCC 10958 / CBS 173.52 / CDC B-1940 / NIH 8579) TaxID=1442370 RepID=A0A0D2G452_CLAB1|nr:uncharacterized protein Z519_06047 [Cladophialophora bantiana CBS 173.52]KIW93442.1 hypothetical protein Z519_06047 [Cladophialophora bantiana CBS 173.52]